MTETGDTAGGDTQEPIESLNVPPKVPTLQVMRGRTILGLVLGVAGLCLGVVGIVFMNPVVIVVAAACAVVSCFAIAGVTLQPLLTKTTHAESPPEGHVYVGTPKPATDNSVVDQVTELPDGRYFEVAVEDRVAAARRHLWPVSVVLLQVGLDDKRMPAGPRNIAMASFANLMRKTLREADIACRIDEITFGLILEDTSEEGGVWTAERIQIALSHDVHGIRSLVAGVAAYPTHGLYAKDVLIRARAALSRASSTPVGHGFGQVEVAHVDLS